MNDWNGIRQFYAKAHGLIQRSQQNVWAVGANSFYGLVDMTPIELAMWQAIRKCNAVFYPQYPVENYFLDFANPVVRVAIECDGKEFHKDKGRDAERDSHLERLGWEVYRISGSMCLNRKEIDPDVLNYPVHFVQRIAQSHGLIRAVARPTSFSFAEALQDGMPNVEAQ